MIPILYESTETEFLNNGICRLRECLRCEVFEERNGLYEVEFDYPVTGAHYNDIICGRIIAVNHDETDDVQPFDIISYSRNINGVVTFRAQHISYRQKGIVVAHSGTPSLQTAFMWLKQTDTPVNPFFYYSDIDTEARITAFDGTPRTVRELLGGVEGSILDACGGEFEWDKFNVNLWKSRGQEKNITIRYGVNMTDFKDEMDYSNAYTAAVPFWKNGDSIIVGYLADTDVERYGGRVICVPLDLSNNFEQQPTQQALRSAAREYITSNQTYLPTRTINVDFVRLQDTEEYQQLASLQKCKLCDSLKVIFPLYNVEGTFRIVKVVWDALLERYTKMELGDLSTTLSEALGISSSGPSGSASSATFESGTITGSSVSANSYKDYEVTFNKSFPSAPIVVACFQSTSTAGDFGNCTLGIVSTSATGFTVRVFNGDASGRGPNINWIAVKA